MSPILWFPLQCLQIQGLKSSRANLGVAKRLETPNTVTHPRRPESPHIIFATELYSATNNVLYSERSPLTTLTPMNLSSSLWFIPASCNGVISVADPMRNVS